MKNKLLLPFRWLFAKKRRWIPVIVILALIALPYITIGSYYLYQRVDNAIDNMRYRHDEKERIEQLRIDLEENKEKWMSFDISDYEFTLDIYFGGESYWEENSHGRGHGSKESKSLHIDVSMGNTVNITDYSTGNSVSIVENQYCDSIPDLFTIIEDVLNRNDNQDLNLKASVLEKVGVPPYVPNAHDPGVSLQAEFNAYYGYPEFISVYYHFGNYENFHRIYVIRYELSEYFSLEYIRRLNS